MLTVFHFFHFKMREVSFFRWKRILLAPIVFTEEWVPDKLIARRDKLEKLRGIIEDESKRSAYVFGSRGLGKTLTCKVLLAAYPPDRALYIPCERSIEISVERALSEKGFKVRGEKIVEFLPRHFRVVVFDDWNKLYNYRRSMDFLFFLHRFNVERRLAVIVIGPWTFKEFEEICPQDVMSRYQFTPVSFGPYSTEELIEIYKQRVDRAFKDYEEEALKFIAHKVRRLGSDVRIGLRMLQFAWSISGGGKLTYEAVEGAWRMEKKRYWRDEVLLGLEPHAALLLYLIAKHALEGEIPVYSSKLLDSYRRFCQNLSIKPLYEGLLRYYMRKLDGMGYISREAVSLGKHGLQSKITLLFDEPHLIVEAGEEIEWAEIL